MYLRTLVIVSLLAVVVQAQETKSANDDKAATVVKLADEWLGLAAACDLIPAKAPGQPGGMLPSLPSSAVTPPQVSQVNLPPGAGPVITPQSQVSLTQSLLTSQNPASAVVGSRLERTRIVGNPGTTNVGAGIRFNPFARVTLHLPGTR
jgi:hypothetical protein